MKIKVCGMRDPKNIALVADLKPDYMGFIFYKRSFRYAGNMPAAALYTLPATICKVGIFVNSSYSEICRHIDTYRLDMVQLHGDETVEFCASVRKICPVIKSVGIALEEDMENPRYDGAVDYLLFDTKSPFYGGSGERFDWDILKKYDRDTPFFISGGVGEEDAFRLTALQLPAFYAVDLNSRFETFPALKDTELLKKFIETVRKKTI